MSSRVTSWRAWLVILAVVSVACDKKKADAPTEPKGSSASAAPSTKPSDVAAPTLSRKSEPAVPGDAGDAITKENFCDRLHAPLARLVKQRCTDADRQNLPAASAAHDRVLKVWPQTCRELMSPERVVLREQKARACIAAYDAYATAGFPPKVTMRMSWELPECASVFEGKQDVGAPCKGWADCKSGLFCVRREATADASLSEGTCKMHAKLGEACEKGYPAFDDTSNCETGSYCNSSTSKCAPPQKEGGECWWERDACAAGLECRARKCVRQARARPGDSCVVDEDCGPQLVCAEGDAGADAKSCVPRKAQGQPCADDSECKGSCEKHRCVSFCGSG